MKLTVVILVLVVLIAVLVYYLLFPANTFIMVSTPAGGGITFGRTSISREAPPDHYASNGFNPIQFYVAKLLVPTSDFKFLSIFTPDGSVNRLSVRLR